MALCQDNLNEIISHLARKELYHFSLTCSFYHDLINFKQIIIDTIHQRLKDVFEQDYKKFVELMIANNGFIAGSLIIQAILNEHWLKSDIDIFVPVNVLREEYFAGNIYTFNPLEDFLYGLQYQGYEEISNYMGKNEIKTHNDIYRVRSYVKLDKPKIQIISVTGNYNFINEWTDFEICKNSYNYQNLMIKNIISILNKTFTFHCTNLLEQSIRRYHKYTKRGFNITKIHYNELKMYDQYHTKIITETMVSDNIKQFVDVKIKHKKCNDYTDCIKKECIIGFYDTCDHKHGIICYYNKNKNYITLT